MIFSPQTSCNLSVTLSSTPGSSLTIMRHASERAVLTVKSNERLLYRPSAIEPMTLMIMIEEAQRMLGGTR
jgi:hypothetical protein